MADRKLIETFSEGTVSRLTGVSVWQLRSWDRDGFFSPSLTLSRLYSFRDVVSLRVVNALRNKAKCTLDHLREVKDKLLALGEDAWTATTLYVVKKRVVFINPKTEKLEEIISGQGVFEIALKAETGDVREAIQRMNTRKPEQLGKFERKRKVANNQLVFVGTRIPVDNVKAFASEGYVHAKRSLFNKVVGDNDFELAFAGFLDSCNDIVSFAKNSRQLNPGFSIEYRNAAGAISNYYPDFLVKRSDKEVLVIETKGREDLDDPPKWERLKQWVGDATSASDGITYRAMFVREEDWDRRPLHGFAEAQAAFERD